MNKKDLIFAILAILGFGFIIFFGFWEAITTECTLLSC